ncbi:GntR family transcriptional regulator [Sulfitobacter dubius]|uniref:GntR family transcriptional regulator n=1 Tax=Sulfitobacter dubius TaxID=218673 RepID=UPI0022B04513|nr:GntR family transcriptional regulator [Sulfitobacter dubius]MCZ4368821.1 GntR family transcriptional regulator [Sulfitobacter dubius]
MESSSDRLSLETLVTAWEDTAPDGKGRPKYLRLSEAFTRCIQEGTFAPGGQLPGETEIAAALPIGLSTVQKGLSRLVEQGLIVRHRKRGSFIADASHQVPEVHVYRFRDPETGDWKMPYTRVVDIQRLPTAESGPLLIGFEAEQVIRIDRLVWVTGSQPAFGTMYLRCDHAEALLSRPLEELHGISYHRMLWEQFQIRTAKVRHEARADLLSRQACQHLDLAAPHVGMIWDAHEHDAQDRLQLIQRFELPRGHRSMELVESKPGF